MSCAEHINLIISTSVYKRLLHEYLSYQVSLFVGPQAHPRYVSARIRGRTTYGGDSVAFREAVYSLVPPTPLGKRTDFHTIKLDMHI